ncbi:hypothetical protein [Halogranum rubrum]|uniref:Uncharacterized protein n=1 Tax=Halogranum salarium B-1 TaxID=1210908 RepID=J3JDJ7_9EURY|nr:hypothetical protein [Halogranum salarium]EJN57549.1 hypothetical protein HSB1_39100 [Halogranum salarium B-1]
MSSRNVLKAEEIGWVFPDLRLRGAGQGGDLTQFTMEGELETFVREVLQNANDATDPESEKPVDVEFKIRDISGERLKNFKEAFRWNHWKSQVDAAAQSDNQIAQRIHRFADRVESEDQLRVLIVEDKHTQGLTGPDEDRPGRGSTNFSALVRDSLESNKSQEASGGKFGLGKAVLRIFSGTSTVFFNSVLSEPDPRPNSPRLIGRTRLPQHWRAETRHNGQGFFGDTAACEDEFEPPVSLWGSSAQELAEQLQFPREDYETPGTSIMIVGFRDPSREEPRDADELAQAICNEAEKWFWPAIWRGGLEVRTSTESESFTATPESNPSIEPFIECLENADGSKVLEGTGDVVHESLDISIPDRTAKPAKEMTDQGKVGLAVRLTMEDKNEYTNHVALIRGAGMVVRYWNRSKLVHGNRNFHAVTLGGEARAWLDDEEPTADDTDVEMFLKDAEPPAHDDWMQTDATRDDYKLGSKKTISGLKDDIESTISQLVGPKFDRGARGPQLLANRFPLTNQGTREEPTGESRLDGKVSIRRDNESQRWLFEGRVVPVSPDHELVEVEITLPRMSEERQMPNDFVRIDRFTELPEDCSEYPRDNGNAVVITPYGGASEITFKGESDIDRIGAKTRINIEGTVRDVGGETEADDE